MFEMYLRFLSDLILKLDKDLSSRRIRIRYTARKKTKAAKSMQNINPDERFEGRTHREEWTRPVRYAVLEASMGRGGGIDSWIGEARDVDVAAMTTSGSRNFRCIGRRKNEDVF